MIVNTPTWYVSPRRRTDSVPFSAVCGRLFGARQSGRGQKVLAARQWRKQGQILRQGRVSRLVWYNIAHRTQLWDRYHLPLIMCVSLGPRATTTDTLCITGTTYHLPLTVDTAVSQNWILAWVSEGKIIHHRTRKESGKLLVELESKSEKKTISMHFPSIRCRVYLWCKTEHQHNCFFQIKILGFVGWEWKIALKIWWWE